MPHDSSTPDLQSILKYKHNMNNYLQTVKLSKENFINIENIYIVMGNESCDLDSAVCAMVYGYFLYDIKKNENCTVLPLLNISEEEFPLRTETKYLLQKHSININNLTFRNNIDLLSLQNQGKLKLILVDHHVLPGEDKVLKKSVIEVIDHRPLDSTCEWKNVSVNVDPVGSCATLIGKTILDKKPQFLDELIIKLLHATIILDTVNFDANAIRFKNLDKEVAQKLEEKIEFGYTREQIFQELVSARSDVSSLTPYQILHRDMKIIQGVPFPGLPMLIDHFLALPNAEQSLKEFCQSKKVSVIVLMGLLSKNNCVSRDIAVFSMTECQLKKQLVETLQNQKDIGLSVVEKNISGLVLFAQRNLKYSRKHIVPILNSVITNFANDITLLVE